MILEGNVSVKAAILAGNRTIEKLIVSDDNHNKDTAWIIHRAKERNIPVETCPREKIDALTSGRTHGGLIAQTGPRMFQKEEECLKGNDTFVVVLEGIEDPFNLGYIARSLYSAGCTGILIRERNWESSEPVIVKASAGAWEYINVVSSCDLPSSITYFRNNGVFAYGAMRNDSSAYTHGNYRQPVLIAIGGEMRGLSRGVRDTLQQNIHIPYANDFRMALNASGAASVLGFEVFRQRNSCISNTDR